MKTIRTLHTLFIAYAVAAIFMPPLYSQDGARFIVVDQFGYLPNAPKTAVIRDPHVGYDADDSYTPGSTFSVIDFVSGDTVFTGAPVSWKSGQIDGSSGDRAWHFDFTDVDAPGSYFILDQEKGMRSYTFRISHNIYNEVLKAAVRTFFYQRAGYPKDALYAGEAWADGASHVRDLQDLNCRSFFAKDDPETERNVSGGWYDAGDYNKYTNWTANYVVSMMNAYTEHPEAFGDDYNIPESGNGIPDLLDEAMWGIDHLVRMQLPDGAVLSIVGLAHGSPPSSATDPSYYGPPNTSATLNTAAAFARSAGIFRSIGLEQYADTLIKRAEMAWDWAEIYPDSLFDNNSAEYNSQGLGAGLQEVDNYGRTMIKTEAACYLFEETGDTKYRDYFDANYNKGHLITWSFAYPFEIENQKALLHYLTIPEGTASVKDNIRNKFRNSVLNGETNMGAVRDFTDPYSAYIKDYTWGSNRVKAAQANMYMDLLEYDFSIGDQEELENAAYSYVHYFHGINPLSMVYLSNMYEYGAGHSVNEFYHSWFSDGSVLWDRVGTSTYGPAPGYLTGGPNPNYDWDGCCPSGCGSSSNNSKCNSESIAPPKDQPNQKSYKDFNTSWPLNSWSVTENSCGYQVQYIRLLSKFVVAGADCNGEPGGTAYFDACGSCAGGNTGITPVTDPGECTAVEDCNGDAGGVAFEDSCGICSGGETGRIPVLDRSDCYDCNEVFNGDAFIDSCGICSGGDTGREPVLEEADCYDCSGEFNGSAFIDSCGICAGGNTGIIPVLDPDACDNSIELREMDERNVSLYPNPNRGLLQVENPRHLPLQISVFNINGARVVSIMSEGDSEIDLRWFESGFYHVIVDTGDSIFREKLILL